MHLPTYPKIKNIFSYDGDGNYLYGSYSMPEIAYLKNNVWIFEEKIDGTNIRIIYDGNKIEIKGRKEQSIIPKGLLQALEEIFNKEMLREFWFVFGEKPVILFGEGVGPKIQKRGKHYFDGKHNFVLFDVMINGKFESRAMVETVSKIFKLTKAPTLGFGTLDDAIKKAREGFKSTFGDVEAEGIVARPLFELQTVNGERIITKIRTEDFKHIKKDVKM